MRCINENKNPIIEGQIRAKELSQYLDDMKSTKCVWLSEDGTAILAKVSYDPKTNQLIGLVLPNNKSTGCSTPFTFLATDADTIKRHLMQEKSNIVHVVMAQPIDETKPPFMIQMFGSSNKFRALDVIKRWAFTKTELEK